MCDEILEKVPFMLDIKFLKANWLIDNKYCGKNVYFLKYEK